MMILKEIKWFIQRGRRGWADCDVWDIGYYLSDWMPDALRKLKNELSGCPDELFDRKRKGRECHHWEDCLETMAKGFEAHNKISNLFFNYHNKKEYKHLQNQRKVGLELFAQYFGNLWD